MSDYFLAIILSVIQGLTEFLPISSSAHLLFPTLIFGTNDLGLLFDVATHLGTLLAVITYFRKDLVEIFVAWCPGLKNNEQRFNCLLYTSPSPRDKRQSRMPSSA